MKIKIYIIKGDEDNVFALTDKEEATKYIEDPDTVLASMEEMDLFDSVAEMETEYFGRKQS